MMIYYEYYRHHNSNPDYLMELMQSFSSFVELDNVMIKAVKSYSYQNIDQWIDLIDEDDFVFVQQLIKRVKTNRISEEKFQELVREM